MLLTELGGFGICQIMGGYFFFSENVCQLGVMGHTYNPSYSGGGSRRITGSGYPGQKHKTICQKQN
jgi:hypothetical protein